MRLRSVDDILSFYIELFTVIVTIHCNSIDEYSLVDMTHTHTQTHKHIQKHTHTHTH